MRRMKRIIAGSALLWLAAGLASHAQLKAADIREHADDPYTGSVRIELFNPQGERSFNQTGKAGAGLTLKPGGGLDVALDGTLQSESQPALSAQLKPDGKGGWADTDDDLKMFISPEGVISGSGRKDAAEVEFSGNVTDSRFQLEVRATLVEEDGSGAPPGSRLQYTFSLNREKLARQQQTAAGADGECDRIVMQARNIANLSGGAMQMIMVPVCVSDRKD